MQPAKLVQVNIIVWCPANSFHSTVLVLFVHQYFSMMGMNKMTFLSRLQTCGEVLAISRKSEEGGHNLSATKMFYINRMFTKCKTALAQQQDFPSDLHYSFMWHMK